MNRFKLINDTPDPNFNDPAQPPHPPVDRTAINFIDFDPIDSRWAEAGDGSEPGSEPED